jgi:hypothetical protein
MPGNQESAVPFFRKLGFPILGSHSSTQISFHYAPTRDACCSVNRDLLRQYGCYPSGGADVPVQAERINLRIERHDDVRAHRATHVVRW